MLKFEKIRREKVNLATLLGVTTIEHAGCLLGPPHVLRKSHFLLCNMCLSGSADLRARKVVQVNRARPSGKGAHGYVAHIFVFPGDIVICRLYKLALSGQPQVILQPRVNPCDFV